MEVVNSEKEISLCKLVTVVSWELSWLSEEQLIYSVKFSTVTVIYTYMYVWKIMESLGVVENLSMSSRMGGYLNSYFSSTFSRAPANTVHVSALSAFSIWTLSPVWTGIVNQKHHCSEHLVFLLGALSDSFLFRSVCHCQAGAWQSSFPFVLLLSSAPPCFSVLLLPTSQCNFPAAKRCPNWLKIPSMKGKERREICLPFQKVVEKKGSTGAEVGGCLQGVWGEGKESLLLIPLNQGKHVRSQKQVPVCCLNPIRVLFISVSHYSMYPSWNVLQCPLRNMTNYW